MINSVNLGIAESVHFYTMTTNEIKEKLQNILENGKYKENVKKISKRFRDQKEKPIDRAIWWINWVLRNPNADYLKSPMLRLGFFVGNAYDLIAFVTFVIILILYIFVKIFLICCYLKQKTEHMKVD